MVVLTNRNSGGPTRVPGLIQFDLDGTLLDTTEMILLSMRHAVNDVFGNNYSDEVLMSEVGIPLITQMEHFCPEDPERAFKTYLEFQSGMDMSLLQAYDGIFPLLERLKGENYKLVVVTSKRHESARHHLEVTNLLGYFDFIIGADDVKAGKPDPYPVLYAAQKAQCPIQKCVYLGDSPFDMQSANGAGAFSIAALWGMFTKEELLPENPVALAKTPYEVYPHIQEMVPCE